jgi:hypothetical protein
MHYVPAALFYVHVMAELQAIMTNQGAMHYRFCLIWIEYASFYMMALLKVWTNYLFRNEAKQLHIRFTFLIRHK